MAFVDQHRDVSGVESICAVLPIAPSTYCRHKAQQWDPSRRSARARRDDVLRVEIQRVWDGFVRITQIGKPPPLAVRRAEVRPW